MRKQKGKFGKQGWKCLCAVLGASLLFFSPGPLSGRLLMRVTANQKVQSAGTAGYALTRAEEASSYLQDLVLDLGRRWGGLSLSGFWELKARRGFGDLLTSSSPAEGEPSPIPFSPHVSTWGLEQELSLMLDATVNRNIFLTLSLSSQGVWGVGAVDSGSYGLNPTFGPLLIENAFARYSTPCFTLQAGRFPLKGNGVGLLADTSLMPSPLMPEALEALVVQGPWQGGVSLARLSSFAAPSSAYILASDDLITLQLARDLGSWRFAYRYLPTELSDAKGHSFAWEGQLGKLSLSGESAFYYPSSTRQGPTPPGWAKAVVLEGKLALLRPRSREWWGNLRLSYGYVEAGFTPYATRLQGPGWQDPVNGESLPFWPNSQGVTLTVSHRLRPGLLLQIGGRWLSPLDRKAAASTPEAVPLRVLHGELVQTLGHQSSLKLSAARQYLESKPERQNLSELALTWEVAF